jgi:hypothetical protein
VFKPGDRVTPDRPDRNEVGTVVRRVERGGLEAQVEVRWDHGVTARIAESALRLA